MNFWRARSRAVLILVLVEDGLRDVTYTSPMTGKKWVLILVLVEDGLRDICQNNLITLDLMKS